MGLRNPHPWNDAQFQALLAWLDADPNQAAAVYAKLHQRLRIFFESWRDAARHAEELADAAIDRAIRKLAEEPELAARSSIPYIRTIAHYILKEYRAQPQTVPLVVDVSDPRANSQNESLDETRCLNRCLGRLSSGDYELIVGYYSHDRAEDAVKWRKDILPRKLGKSYGALRVQVLRIRKALEECIEHCRNGALVTLPGPEHNDK